MAHLFLYGNLCHLPLLDAVLGVDKGDLAHRVEQAQLAGHRVSWVKNEAHPMIERDAACLAEGILLTNLSKDEEDRLTYYEGAFSYHLVDVSVAVAGRVEKAVCFYPMSVSQDRGDPWNLDDWVRVWGEMAVGAAKDVMIRRDRYDAETAAHLRPFLMARHWSRHLARDAAPTSLRYAPDEGDVTIREQLSGYKGFFELAEFQFDHKRFDGTRSPSVRREAFLAYDAALVLPYDPNLDQVLLIEQLRFGPLWREDPNPWVFEPIAGLVDAGEDPKDAARREAVEEAGLTLGPLEEIAKVYASPGYSTEYFHCYLAVTDMTEFTPSATGLVSEHEDIRSHVLSFAEAMALVSSGEVNAGPLVMMLYWLAANRPRLQAAA